MVAPDMATMLVYIFTDAKIGQRQLQTLVNARRAISREITLADVDGRPLWQRLRDGVCRQEALRRLR